MLLNTQCTCSRPHECRLSHWIVSLQGCKIREQYESSVRKWRSRTIKLMEFKRVTIGDIDTAHINSITASIEELDLPSVEKGLLSNLRSATKEASKSGLALLHELTRVHFRPDDMKEPFDAMVTYSDGSRSLVGSDLNHEELKELWRIAPHLENIALRTRIADLVWWRDKRNVEAGAAALQGYLHVAKVLNGGEAKLSFETRSRSSKELENALLRGITIARVRGSKPKEIAAFYIEARRALNNAREEGGASFSRFARFALDNRIPKTKTQLKKISGEVRKQIDAGNYHLAQNLQELAIRHARQCRDRQWAEKEALKLVDIFELEAESAPSFFVRAHCLENALEGLRGIKGQADKRIEIYHKLKIAQLNATEEMGSVETENDLSEIVKSHLKDIEDFDWLDTVRYLSRIMFPPTREKVEEELNEIRKDGLIASLFPSVILDHRSRPIARTQSNFDEGPSEHDVAKHLQIWTHLLVRGAINPILRRLTERSYVGLDGITEICNLSPAVPPESLHMISGGIWSFLHGDQHAAAIRLIPYFEAIIREIVVKGGGIDTRWLESKTEEVSSLTWLLRNYRPHLEQTLTPEFVFAIEIMFVSDFGPNLRHGMCHGFMPDSAYYSDWTIYGCGLILAIIVLPLVKEDRWNIVRERLEAVECI